MKRTLIVAETSYAGMGPYVSEIANSFNPSDDVYFFFYELDDDFYPRNIKEELFSKSVFVKGSNTLKYKLYTNLTWKYGFDNQVLNLCDKWDIEQVYFINGCCDPSLARKMKKKGITTISAVHDLHPHEAKKSFIKMIKHYNFYARNKWGRESCEACITNSVEQYNELKELYPQKHIYFHEFPSLVTDIVASGKMQVKELKDNKSPYILFFGRIEKYKGVDVLIDAFSKFDKATDVKLVIAGKGNAECEQKPNDNVILINRFIKDEEIASLYKGASFVVYPYISATQSGVLSLAMFFETPIIASDVPYFKQVLNDSNTGLLFKNGNADDLYLKMKDMLTMDCNGFKANEKKYYENKYERQSIHTALIDIFSNN